MPGTMQGLPRPPVVERAVVNHGVNPGDSQGSSPSRAGTSRPVCKDWEQLFEEWTEFLLVSISFSVE